MCAWEHLRTVSEIASTVEDCIDFEALGLQHYQDREVDYDLLFQTESGDFFYLDVYTGGQDTV